MNSGKREMVPARGFGVEDPKRRDLAMALFGVFGGTALFQGHGHGGGNTCACPSPQTIAVDAIGVSPLTGGDLNLRGLTGSPAAHFAIALGYNTPGDGGGGLFAWFASDSTDDGGTVIVAGQALGSTTAGPHWRRIYNGSLNVQWFGALGDNTDQTAAISRCLGIARSISLDASEYAGSTPSRIAPAVFFPKGKYLVTSPLDVGDITLIGDGAQVFSTNAAIELIAINGNQNLIRGFVFAGGRFHIRINGAVSAGGNVVISDCEFNFTAAGPSDGGVSIIVTDGGRRRITIERFKHTGGPFFRGQADLITLRAGRLDWNQTLGHCIEITGSELLCEDILGVPNGLPTPPNAWIRTDSATSVTCQRFQFEGELPPFRQTGIPAAAIVLLVQCKTDPSTRTAVSLRDCKINSSSLFWMSITDVFPARINVSGCRINGTRILVDDAAVATLVGFTGQGLMGQFLNVDFDDPSECHFMRVDGSVLNGAQLSNFVANRHDAQSLVSQANLFTAGFFASNQPGLIGGTNVGYSWLPGADDVSTGYALPTFGVHDITAVIDINSPTWGAGVPPGVYCFSLFIRTSQPCTATLKYKNLRFREFILAGTGAAYQRIYGTFWHDGTPNNWLGVAIENLTFGTTGNFGLFAVSAGEQPAPYTFPGNEVSGAPVQQIFYATSPPTAGTFKQGDLVYNTAPAVGGYLGWVFTVQSEWKPFGLIAS